MYPGTNLQVGRGPERKRQDDSVARRRQERWRHHRRNETEPCHAFARLTIIIIIKKKKKGARQCRTARSRSLIRIAKNMPAPVQARGFTDGHGVRSIIKVWCGTRRRSLGEEHASSRCGGHRAQTRARQETEFPEAAHARTAQSTRGVAVGNSSTISRCHG